MSVTNASEPSDVEGWTAKDHTNLVTPSPASPDETGARAAEPFLVIELDEG